MELLFEIEPKIEFLGRVVEKNSNTIRLTAIDVDPKLVQILKAMAEGACIYLKATGPKSATIRAGDTCAIKSTIQAVTPEEC